MHSVYRDGDGDRLYPKSALYVCSTHSAAKQETRAPLEVTARGGTFNTYRTNEFRQRHFSLHLLLW
ncbi:hypothetical protein WN55_01957 [Dufourea novaeangliae]|uniref:Uncharacterized protein n=1 Tax=Dufourea novaeangliae TaxID=178035 RepID=A0A154PH67_DUFNO|nr:hypothetical protein WN55_01957 [Dufourea novaeangliae]